MSPMSQDYFVEDLVLRNYIYYFSVHQINVLLNCWQCLRLALCLQREESPTLLIKIHICYNFRPVLIQHSDFISSSNNCFWWHVMACLGTIVLPGLVIALHYYAIQ